MELVELPKFKASLFQFEQSARVMQPLRDLAIEYCLARAAEMSGVKAGRLRVPIKMFVTAVENSGGELHELPPDFMAKHFVPLRIIDPIAVHNCWKPIRAFANWLTTAKGLPVSEILPVYPSYAKAVEAYDEFRKTNPPKQIKPRGKSMASRREEQALLKKLVADKMAQEMAAVTAQSQSQLPMPQVARTPPHIPPSIQASIQHIPPPIQASIHEAVLPLPANDLMDTSKILTIPPMTEAPKPRMMKNPISAWLPSGYRLRVWKEGPPGEEDIHVKDWRTEQILRYGSIESFLEEVVRPAYGPFPGQGDRVYLAAIANAQGACGQKGRFPVASAEAIPGALPGYPNLGANAAIGPEQNIYAMYDQLRQSEERVTQLVKDAIGQTTVPGAPPNPMLTALQAQQMDLVRHIEALKSQLPQSAQTMIPPSTSDTQPLIDLISQLTNQLAHKQAAVGPVTTGNSLIDAIQVMGTMQANTMAMMEKVRPQNDTITVVKDMMREMMEKFEERLEDIEDRSSEKKSDMQTFFDTLSFFRNMTGSDPNMPWFKQKESDSLIGMLGDVMKEGLRNAPTILDKYREVVTTVAAAQHGISTPPQMSAPAQLQASTQEAPQMSAEQLAKKVAEKRRNEIPANLRAAIEALLSAKEDEDVGEAMQAVVTAFHDIAEKENVAIEEMKKAGKQPPPSQTKDVLEKFMTYIEVGGKAHFEGDTITASKLDSNMAGDMRRIMVFLGYADAATPQKINEIIVAIRRLQIEEMETKDDDEEELSNGVEKTAAPAKMTTTQAVA